MLIKQVIGLRKASDNLYFRAKHRELVFDGWSIAQWMMIFRGILLKWPFKIDSSLSIEIACRCVAALLPQDLGHPFALKAFDCFLPQHSGVIARWSAAAPITARPTSCNSRVSSDYNPTNELIVLSPRTPKNNLWWIWTRFRSVELVEDAKTVPSSCCQDF